jgi:hypothetical protein
MGDRAVARCENAGEWCLHGGVSVHSGGTGCVFDECRPLSDGHRAAVVRKFLRCHRERHRRLCRLLCRTPRVVQCERVGAFVVADDFENMLFDEIVAPIALRQYIGAELYFVARVERRADRGRVGDQSLEAYSTLV